MIVFVTWILILTTSTMSSTTTLSTISTTPCPPLKVVNSGAPDMSEYWLAEQSSKAAREECGNGCLYKDRVGEEYCFKPGQGMVDNFVYKHQGL